MMYRLKKTLLLLKAQRVLVAAFLSLTMALAFTFIFLYSRKEEYLLYAILFSMTLAWIVCDALLEDRIGTLQGQVADLKDRLCLAEHEAENCRLELEARREAAEKRKEAKRKKKVNHETENQD